MEHSGRTGQARIAVLLASLVLAASVVAAPPDKKGKGGPESTRQFALWQSAVWTPGAEGTGKQAGIKMVY